MVLISGYLALTWLLLGAYLAVTRRLPGAYPAFTRRAFSCAKFRRFTARDAWLTVRPVGFSTLQRYK